MADAQTCQSWLPSPRTNNGSLEVTQDKEPTSQPKSAFVSECPDVVSKMNGCSIPFVLGYRIIGHFAEPKLVSGTPKRNWCDQC